MSGKVLSQTPMFVFWDFEWRKCQEHCPFLHKSLCSEGDLFHHLVLLRILRPPGKMKGEFPSFSQNVKKIPLFYTNLCVLFFWMEKISGKFPISKQILCSTIFSLGNCKENYPHLHKSLFAEILILNLTFIWKQVRRFPSSIRLIWFWVR